MSTFGGLSKSSRWMTERDKYHWVVSYPSERTETGTETLGIIFRAEVRQ